MSKRPLRQRPSGPQLPRLQPKVEAIRIGGVEPSIAATPESGSPVTPKQAARPRYQQFERRDARLRPEQWRAIEDLAARIKHARQDKRERITASTMLRVAVDLLLTRQAELAGDTEAALRASLGLPRADSTP